MGVPGIFCMNSNCKHYFEDSCLLFYEKETIEISYEGKCNSFKKGINEAYKLSEENEHDGE